MFAWIIPGLLFWKRKKVTDTFKDLMDKALAVLKNTNYYHLARAFFLAPQFKVLYLAGGKDIQNFMDAAAIAAAMAAVGQEIMPEDKKAEQIGDTIALGAALAQAKGENPQIYGQNAVDQVLAGNTPPPSKTTPSWLLPVAIGGILLLSAKK